MPCRADSDVWKKRGTIFQALENGQFVVLSFREGPEYGESVMNNKRGKDSIQVLTSKALGLAALVNYQDGAVVSKTIIKKKTGTVTVFAFAKGEGLSTHSAPFDALVQILDGEALITIAGKSTRVKRGEMIILPADKPHALRALKPFKMMLVMVKS
jgi:quercetin dioxygenase-like cupin family protein